MYLVENELETKLSHICMQETKSKHFNRQTC